jgi:hypothetical protein
MTPIRASIITRYLKRVDKRLSAQYAGNGLIQVLFSEAKVNKHVFSLTDNWSSDGNPIPLGIEPVLLRLRQVDMSGNETYFEQMRKQRESAAKSKERDFKNRIEDGVREARPQFAKAFNDYNTSTLDKTKDKRRIKGA